MVQIAIPFLVLGMLGYMFWRSAAHMRRDRVLAERERTRGRRAFAPIHRARFLLGRAFAPRRDQPGWQAELARRLDQVSRPDAS